MLATGYANAPLSAGRSLQSDVVYSAFVTSAACGPFCPCTISNSTLSPSARDLKPLPWMALKWTKTSGPPSRDMKPNPFASLNHFTVPEMRSAILLPPYLALPTYRTTARTAVLQAEKSGNFYARYAGLSGAGDVSGNPSAFLAGQGHVGGGGRRLLIGVARDGSGAGGAAQRLAVAVVGNEAERLKIGR